MRLLQIFSVLLIFSFSMGACEDLLEPVNDNRSTIDRVVNDPAFAEGLLLSAYTRLPTGGLGVTYIDVATDDAVTSQLTNAYRRMATGEWSAIYNPVSVWDQCNAGILYINNFLEIVDTVTYKWTRPAMNDLYIRRLTGESYALRAWLQYHLLQTVAGPGPGGEMLGIPIYDKFLMAGDNFNVPRATFTESVNQIYADINKSLEYLTMDDYVDINDPSELPPGLAGTDITEYNEVFGKVSSQRISARIAKALRGRVALLAASPAYSDGGTALWEAAANYAGATINGIGGIAGLDPDGHIFYHGSQVDAISLVSGIDQPEMVWRSSVDPGYGNPREQHNFPPSLYGWGRINPTQNLVDAFPMANGYPISDPLSGYDENDPYAGRDPRLGLYIVYNGSTMSGETIITGVGGGENAKDSLNTSTRTGYYLKKLLREDANMDPAQVRLRTFYDVHMRYTEVFLNYAEAANEAWGPDGSGANGFSARDVIATLRQRAGIEQPDEYLASISDQDAMRELIRNERRLELCFEGHRFWDLRRWKADLTETARGININSSGSTVINIETREYNNDFMHYGPLPQGEVIKFNALIQNRGW